MKTKSIHRCTNCGHEEPKFFGQCPQCDEYGTAEEKEIQKNRKNVIVSEGGASFTNLKDVQQASFQRTHTGLSELDRVLGGGLVPGSYIVLSGEPGAGKTTMASEIILQLGREGEKVAYLSGEESEAQARLRFERLGADLNKDQVLISTETSCEKICDSIRNEKFSFLVVDSIQTCYSEILTAAPGSVSQIRECGAQLMRAAKDSGASVLIIGQVTKGGDMAGPRTLEHMVDVVLSFEGDRREQYRILRGVKNRFGSTDEIGVFEMTSSGLKGISDPSQLFLESEESLPGSCFSTIIEGTRPLMCEIQALVQASNLPQPIRSFRGLDRNRAQMLIAVIAKNLNLHMNSMDVYLNVSGGLKVDDPAADLAICLALVSAYKQLKVKDNLVAFGEVSLLGTVRQAAQGERREKEAKRLSYTPVDIKSNSLKHIMSNSLQKEE